MLYVDMRASEGITENVLIFFDALQNRCSLWDKFKPNPRCRRWMKGSMCSLMNEQAAGSYK